MNHSTYVNRNKNVNYSLINSMIILYRTLTPMYWIKHRLSCIGVKWYFGALLILSNVLMDYEHTQQTNWCKTWNSISSLLGIKSQI